MKEYLNPNTLANDARMRRGVFKGAFLYLEGPSDEKLYSLFVDKVNCQVIIANGRCNVIETCRILQENNFNGYLGIIDADFDNLESTKDQVSNVFQTDLHDGECLMLSTSAFTKLLNQLAVESKLDTWKNQVSSDIRQHLLQEASKVGYLLWHSNVNNLNLHFQELEVKEYADSKNLKVEIGQLVRHVKNKSARHDLTDQELIQGISERMAASNELWQVVRGHDFVDLFAFGLRYAFGNWKASDVVRDRLELELRLAYSYDHFSTTRLFRQVSEWEISHGTFRVWSKSGQERFAF